MAKDDLDDVFGVAGGDNKEGAEDADAPKEEPEAPSWEPPKETP